MSILQDSSTGNQKDSGESAIPKATFYRQAESWERSVNVGSMGESGYISIGSVAYHDGKFFTHQTSVDMTKHSHINIGIKNRDGKIYFSSRDYLKAIAETNPDLVSFEINDKAVEQLLSSYESNFKPYFTIEIFQDEQLIKFPSI